jgi:hypothetical protein
MFLDLYENSMEYDGEKTWNKGKEIKNFKQEEWMKNIYDIGYHVLC